MYKLCSTLLSHVDSHSHVCNLISPNVAGTPKSPYIQQPTIAHRLGIARSGGSILSSPQGRGPQYLSAGPSLPISGFISISSLTSHHMEAEDSELCLL